MAASLCNCMNTFDQFDFPPKGSKFFIPNVLFCSLFYLFPFLFVELFFVFIICQARSLKNNKSSRIKLSLCLSICGVWWRVYRSWLSKIGHFHIPSPARFLHPPLSFSLAFHISSISFPTSHWSLTIWERYRFWRLFQAFLILLVISFVLRLEISDIHRLFVFVLQ